MSSVLSDFFIQTNNETNNEALMPKLHVAGLIRNEQKLTMSFYFIYVLLLFLLFVCVGVCVFI